jgi:hypothetical protein
MVNVQYIAIRFAVILVAICTAFFVYKYIVKPLILEPLCLVNSNSCVRMTYYAFENSALVQMQNTGLWVWFNGDRAFVYGQPVGQICKEPDKYQAAYSINTRTGLKEGYRCVVTLKEVLDFYKSKGVKSNNLIKKANYTSFDIYAMLNMLDSEGIINLSTSGK